MSYIENLKTEILDKKTKEEIERFERYTDYAIMAIEKKLRENLHKNSNNTTVKGYFHIDYEGRPNPKIEDYPCQYPDFLTYKSDSQKLEIINTIKKKAERLECLSFEIVFKREPKYKTEWYKPLFSSKKKPREVFSHYEECIYIDAQW